MEFGSFKKAVLILFLIIGKQIIDAQETTKASEIIYQQLDNFLNSPSAQNLEKFSNFIISKENKLSTKEDLLSLVIAHSNLGYYYSKYGDIPTGIAYYEKAWKSFNKDNLKDYDIIENCLQPLGNLYVKIGDLKKAEDIITSYMYIAEQTGNIPKIVSAITNLSITYNNQGNHQKAIKILHKGEKLDTKNPNILTNLATNYLDIGALETAKTYALKVLSIDKSEVNAYQILASIALENANIQTAQQQILIAKKHLLKQKNTTSRDIAKWQLAYTDILLSKNEYKEALDNLKEIYKILLPVYRSTLDIPKKELLIADRILLKALDIQAYIYQQANKPDLAIKSLEAAFTVNSKLNITYPLQSTKIIQHSQNRDRTETYIDLLYNLYTKSNEKSYIEKAFEAAESSKAPFVNEALISKTFLSQYQNDALVKKNRQLNIQLANYETQILKEKLKNDQADIKQIQQWTTLYSQTSIELKELSKKLQEKYPNLIANRQIISIPKLQHKLQQDDITLISYFYGKTKVYQFNMNADTTNLSVIGSNDHIKKSIQKYIRYFNNPSNIINDINGFSLNSFQLYQHLKIPKAKKLMIIPDGLLNFIPYEALLTEKSSIFNFEQMPFLLKSSAISYENSAAKFMQSSINKNRRNSILGIFPVFEKTNLELPFSLQEKEYIEEHFNGTFLQSEKATYSQFLDNLKDHSILHLSTHAESGSFSRPASIQFRDQNILVNQLYGLQLEADLVVLSACETGVGVVAKGEGPLSIARGFQYAGVPNALFSLWKVNDKTTSQLMENFYQNLRSYNSKAHGLYVSKLDYLSSEKITNAQKSPYYWASFVYYGVYEHPTQSGRYSWILIAIFFLLIILFLLAVRQKLK
ncbi:CHAT domain-containing protein [Aquimarina litoralis]|uniref:CHAT domain-containing protein n=1 Tax=Aquimarina litoralis TaxID=584605 RepID=UPI001C579B5A|nr:CHAT domain-containing protein [Aquimarina litoralis]